MSPDLKHLGEAGNERAGNLFIALLVIAVFALAMYAGRITHENLPVQACVGWFKTAEGRYKLVGSELTRASGAGAAIECRYEREKP